MLSKQLRVNTARPAPRQHVPADGGGTAARQTQARSASGGAASSDGGGSSKLSISHGMGRYLFLGALFAIWCAVQLAHCLDAAQSNLLTSPARDAAVIKLRC